LKKQIISVFEPMYLDILNDNMVGYAIISARYMLDHLFETYGNITAVDLEINFENMRRAWDPQQPVESLFKQIQQCADYSETPPSLTMKIRWPKSPLEHCQIWQQQPQQTEVSWQLLLRQILVLQNSWRTTPPS
jgi:hypothetical protein